MIIIKAAIPIFPNKTEANIAPTASIIEITVYALQLYTQANGKRCAPKMMAYIKSIAWGKNVQASIAIGR